MGLSVERFAMCGECGLVSELAEVLANACRLGIIAPAEAVLLAGVYRYDQTEDCATELGGSLWASLGTLLPQGR